MNAELRDGIAHLLQDTGHAHQKAFEATDGADVELGDIHQDSQDRDDFIGARGRATVPVSRITSADGEDRRMPESRDIVSYLQQTYG